MAKIKIKRGFYGLHTSVGVKVKGPSDGAFDVDDNEAKRLVDRGIAQYVGDTPVATVEERANEEYASDNSTEIKAAAESEYDGDVETDILPEYGINSTVAELRAIAKDAGISFKVGTTKSEMVAALDEHFGVMDVPDLSAESPVE